MHLYTLYENDRVQICKISPSNKQCIYIFKLYYTVLYLHSIMQTTPSPWSISMFYSFTCELFLTVMLLIKLHSAHIVADQSPIPLFLSEETAFHKRDILWTILHFTVLICLVQKGGDRSL